MSGTTYRYYLSLKGTRTVPCDILLSVQLYWETDPSVLLTEWDENGSVSLPCHSVYLRRRK
jgi:hypothetical protein